MFSVNELIKDDTRVELIGGPACCTNDIRVAVLVLLAEFYKCDCMEDGNYVLALPPKMYLRAVTDTEFMRVMKVLNVDVGVDRQAEAYQVWGTNRSFGVMVASGENLVGGFKIDDTGVLS